MKKIIFCLLLMSSTLLYAQDGTNTLTKGTEISGNQKLISANSLFSLEIAGGVPVIFNSNRDTVWEGSKDINWLGNVGSKLKMQTDGNLCLYTSQNGHTWSYGGPLIGNKAVLENDGRFVLYDNANKPIWLSSYAVPTGIRNPAISPKLISAGSEGIRQSHEIAAGREINLEVIFVDWNDREVPDSIKNFDALWKKISSGDKLINAFRDKGVTVKIKLNKQWKRMPKSFTSYFPTNKGWDWKGYTNDAAALLAAKTYSANTITVVVPNEGVTGFTSVSGAHSISYNGIRRMITLAPDIYNEHYTTMMHEIGHCYGSGELYPAASPYLHEVAGYDLMGDVVYATGFIGYHQFRYGWITTEKMQLLYQKGTYTIDIKKMSSTTGKNMIVIPDKTKQDKLWIIEIGQDVVSRDQFKAGKGEKMNTEGDRLILYTVEEPVESGKRAIRLIPRLSFDANQGSKKWLDDASFIAGQAFSKTNVPFSFTVNSKNSDGFNITVTIEKEISYPKTTTTTPAKPVTNPTTPPVIRPATTTTTPGIRPAKTIAPIVDNRRVVPIPALVQFSSGTPINLLYEGGGIGYQNVKAHWWDLSQTNALDPKQAIDGKKTKTIFEDQCSSGAALTPGWQIDLGKTAYVDHIVIWNSAAASTLNGRNFFVYTGTQNIAFRNKVPELEPAAGNLQFWQASITGYDEGAKTVQPLGPYKWESGKESFIIPIKRNLRHLSISLQKDGINTTPLTMEEVEIFGIVYGVEQ